VQNTWLVHPTAREVPDARREKRRKSGECIADQDTCESVGCCGSSPAVDCDCYQVALRTGERIAPAARELASCIDPCERL
jgi:hypothetical protein